MLDFIGYHKEENTKIRKKINHKITFNSASFELNHFFPK